MLDSSFNCQMYFESSISLPLSQNDSVWLYKQNVNSPSHWENLFKASKAALSKTPEIE